MPSKNKSSNKKSNAMTAQQREQARARASAPVGGLSLTQSTAHIAQPSKQKTAAPPVVQPVALVPVAAPAARVSPSAAASIAAVVAAVSEVAAGLTPASSTQPPAAPARSSHMQNWATSGDVASDDEVHSKAAPVGDEELAVALQAEEAEESFAGSPPGHPSKTVHRELGLDRDYAIARVMDLVELVMKDAMDMASNLPDRQLDYLSKVARGSDSSGVIDGVVGVFFQASLGRPYQSAHNRERFEGLGAQQLAKAYKQSGMVGGLFPAGSGPSSPYGEQYALTSASLSRASLNNRAGSTFGGAVKLGDKPQVSFTTRESYVSGGVLTHKVVKPVDALIAAATRDRSSTVPKSAMKAPVVAEDTGALGPYHHLMKKREHDARVLRENLRAAQAAEAAENALEDDEEDDANGGTYGV